MNSGNGGSDSTAIDDKIKKLQAELEKLKGERGIGSSSQAAVQSESPVSKTNIGASGKKVRMKN